MVRAKGAPPAPSTTSASSKPTSPPRETAAPAGAPAAPGPGPGGGPEGSSPSPSLDGFSLKGLSAGARSKLEELVETPLQEPVHQALQGLVAGLASHRLPAAKETEALQNFQARFIEQLEPHEAAAPEHGKGPPPAERLLSHPATRALQKTLGPDAMGLFELYVDLQKVAFGKRGVPRGFEKRLLDAREALRRVGSTGEVQRLTPAMLNVLNEKVETLLPLVRNVDKRRATDKDWATLRETFRTLVVELGRSREVMLTPFRAEEHGWGPFRLMSEKERQFARLELEDAETFSVERVRRRTYREINAGISEAIAANGMDARRSRILGRVVQIGVDRATGEERVFDLDGSVLPVPDFVQKRLKFLQARERVAKAASSGRGRSLRALSEEALAGLEGNVEYVALTDDGAKSDALTRLLPTRWHEGRRVVVDGRFKGVHVDDLVSVNGRFIERAAWDFDPALGRSRTLPGQSLLREPYVTLTTVKVRGEPTEKLYLQLPNQRGDWTERRQAMRKLAKLVPSIDYVEGSRNTAFRFDAKDFALVRDTLSGLSLSAGALGHVRGYFEELAQAERATAADNLRFYSAQAIGGFKQSLKGPDGKMHPVDLSVEQKQALAWLEANGNRGVCALDTGFGKTLVAIAQMQKLLRDGYDAEPGSNGRFLFVCPPSLRGNITREIRKFLSHDAAQALIRRMDVMSYAQFRNAQRTGTWKGKPFDAKGYVSVLFDEAQEVKQLSTLTTRSALALDHPRKICLTASPMEKNPMEAYVLASISGNVDLGHRVDGKQRRMEMRKFKQRFCETLGGRVVGIKKDPLTKRDLDTWVRRNLFFVDKVDAQGFTLPALQKATEPLVMDEPLEAAYRGAVAEVRSALRALVSVYRDKGVRPEGEKRRPAIRAKELNSVFGLGLRAALQRLNTLSTLPETLVKGAGYPKLDRAAEIVMGRMARSEASRAVLFAEDRTVVETSARELSLRIPGKVHAACLSDQILLYKNGKQLTSYAGHTVPFVQREYRADPSRPADRAENRRWRRNEWQQFVLGEVLSQREEVATLSLMGQTYQQGQNLQAFDTVIHLDRDTWNNEDMKQRTARVWRQGQQNAVAEFTLDMAYASTEDAFDRTLDEIRGYYQDVEGEVFDGIIKEAQSTQLGREWLDETVERRTSAVHTSPDIFDLMLSPYLSRSAEVGG